MSLAESVRRDAAPNSEAARSSSSGRGAARTGRGERAREGAVCAASAETRPETGAEAEEERNVCESVSEEMRTCVNACACMQVSASEYLRVCVHTLRECVCVCVCVCVSVCVFVGETIPYS